MIPGHTAVPSFTPRVNPALFALGFVALGVAVFASGALAFEHLWGVALPGCGVGSACAKLAASVWGKVPGVEWPVSFAGLAYFAAMLAGWIGCRGVAPSWMRLVAAVGALGSAAFIGIMLGMGDEHGHSVCPYCLTAHLANFAFLGVLGMSPRSESDEERPMRAPAAALAALVVVTGALAVVESQAKQNAQTKFKGEADQSVQAMLAQTRANAAAAQKQAAPAAPAATAPARPVAIAPSGPTGPAAMPLAAPQPLPPPGLFTGRYRFGPEKAPVRVVMFTDYQCPDCKLMEAQVEQVLSKYPKDVSVSIRHFPFCIDCNTQIGEANYHKNACWAARAAESAGMLYGTEGFRKMHLWLFAHSGSFTNVELDQGLTELGFAAQRDQFVQMMTQDPEPLRRIQMDIAEAVGYGLLTTPFVFVNGVELKGWKTPNSLVNAVDALEASHPEAMGPEVDHPPRASDSFVQAWREGTAMAWPDRKKPYTQVPLQNPRPQVRVTLFGDLLEPNCAEADRIIRNTVIGDPQVAYEFRYFPFDQSCNPVLPRTAFPGGCLAAKAAEAAGQLGGTEAYWAMHAWIMDNQKAFSAEAAKAQAVKQGLNGDAFVTMMNSPEVAAIIADDISIGSRMQVQEIPRMWVNGKVIPRWKTPGGFVLERIIDEAHKPPVEPMKVVPQIPQIPGVNAPIR